MGYTWVEGGSYFGSFIPGPNGPPNQDPNPAAYLVSSSSVGATVEDSSVEPQIETAGVNYEQPNVSAPADSAEVDASSSLAEAGPNQIEATGENYAQPNTAAPASNPQIGVPCKNLNPLGL